MYFFIARVLFTFCMIISLFFYYFKRLSGQRLIRPSIIGSSTLCWLRIHGSWTMYWLRILGSRTMCLNLDTDTWQATPITLTWTKVGFPSTSLWLPKRFLTFPASAQIFLQYVTFLLLLIPLLLLRKALVFICNINWQHFTTTISLICVYVNVCFRRLIGIKY